MASALKQIEKEGSEPKVPTIGQKLKAIQKEVMTAYIAGGTETELIANLNRLVAVKKLVSKILVDCDGYFDKMVSGDPLLSAHRDKFPNVKRIRKEREVKEGEKVLAGPDPDELVD